MDKYLTENGDPYCYPKTNILINKHNIHDSLELETLEAAVTEANARTLELVRPPYSLATMQEIHKHLFNDLYDWAGQIRTIMIMKGNTPFCYPSMIDSNASKLFADLKSDDWLRGLDKECFCNGMAKHYAEFNMLHPFREGNGRTQRVLFDYLAAINGYYIKWGNVTPSDWITANEYGVIQDYTHLYRIFSNITYEHD